jgi:hypothetical protein
MYLSEVIQAFTRDLLVGEGVDASLVASIFAAHAIKKSILENSSAALELQLKESNCYHTLIHVQ